MAAQVGNRTPAYRTQWISEADEIQHSTGMSRPATDLCISYLFSNTLFRTPREFISYFQENDSLEVPAGQSLEILDISVLDHTGEAPVAWMETNSNELNIGFNTLNRLLAPLAKRIDLVFKEKTTCSWTIGRGIAFTPKHAMTVKMQRGPIDTRLSDLFRLMLMCQIPQVEFAQHQQMRIWGVTEAEADSISEKLGNLEALIRRTCPDGCTVNLASKNAPITTESIHHKKADCFAIAMSAPRLTWSVQDLYQFGNVSALLARLQLGELVVPPNQQLLVGCSYANSIFELAKKLEPGGMDILQVLCDQLLAPYGYLMCIDRLEGSSEINFSLNFLQGTALRISTKTGYRLKLSVAHLFVDLDHFAKSMIAEKRFTVNLSPYQKLLVRLSSTEYGEMCALDDVYENFLAALHRVLIMHSPVGFVWDFRIREGSCTYKFGLLGKVEHCFIQAEGGMTISLKRPDGPTMIATIVNHSHPELLRDLQALEPNAIKFLLFRTFFYYLCGGFNAFSDDDLPDFFKEPLSGEDGTVQQPVRESTVVKILQRMHEPRLVQAIETVNRDETSARKLEEILKMSPDQFDQLTIEQYPAPVQTILKAIQQLAAEQLQGSPFITTHLKAYLASLPPEDSSKDKKDSA